MTGNTVVKKEEAAGREQEAMLPPVDVVEELPASPSGPTCRACPRKS